jgi:hypothetical protein
LLTYHYRAHGLARELEHVAEEEELVVRELVLDAEGDESLELGLAVSHALVMLSEEAVEELASAAPEEY